MRHFAWHTGIQGFPQSGEVHTASLNENPGFGLIPSGFWHHTQDIGHPLKNTVVLIPGPSSLQSRLTSKIKAFSFKQIFLLIAFRIKTKILLPDYFEGCKIDFKFAAIDPNLKICPTFPFICTRFPNNIFTRSISGLPTKPMIVCTSLK